MSSTSSTSSTVLSDQVRSRFSDQVRKRGAVYCDRGKVLDLQSSTDGFKAVVRGTESYRVSGSDIDGDSPKFACTCPHFQDGSHCKHLWAAICQLEEDAQLELIGSAPRSSIAATVPVTPAKPALGPRRLAPKGAGNKKAPAGGGQWMRHFQKVKEAESKPAQLKKESSREVPASRSMPRKNELRYRLSTDDAFIGTKVFVDLEWRREKKVGGWGSWQRFAVGQDTVNTPTKTMDRETVAVLLQAGHTQPPMSEWERWRTFSRFEIPPMLFGFLIPKIVATGAAWLDPSPLESTVTDPEVHLAAYRDASPYHFTLHGEKLLGAVGAEGGVRRLRSKDKWRVFGKLELSAGDQELDPSAEKLSVDDILWLHEAGLVASKSGALLVAKLDPVDVGWLSVLNREGDLDAPVSETSEFIQALYSVKLPTRVALPAELRVRERKGSPMPLLRIEVQSGSGRGPANVTTDSGSRPPSLGAIQRVKFSLRFDYSDKIISADEEAPGWITEDRQQVIRDVDRESAYVRELEEALKKQTGTATSPWLHRGQGATLSDDAASVVRRLVTSLSEDWRVAIDGKRVHKSATTEFKLDSGIDWFELDQSVKVATPEGSANVPLPVLLAAARDGSAVDVGDGKAYLDAETASKVKAVASLVDSKNLDGPHRLQKSQLLVLDALLGDDEDGERQSRVKLKVDAACAELRHSLATFDGVSPAQPPPGFVGELRKYQRYGLGWMKFLRESGLGGCLADDMGLGKTVQVLALLLGNREESMARLDGAPARPFLVVAPKSVVPNWIAEAKRFAPELPVVDYTGPSREGRLDELLATPTPTLVVTTYSVMRIDIATFADIPFDTIVLDEAQAIKNPGSKTARAARALVGDHRLALTGTPVENHLGDAVSIFRFLNPGMVENLPALRALAHPQDKDASLELASAALRPLILRRTKEEVLTDLPKKTEQTLYCDLSPRERNNYDELAAHYRQRLLEVQQANREKAKRKAEAKLAKASGVSVASSEMTGENGAPGEGRELGKNKIVALEALLRLRQAACHQGLLGHGKESSKLDLLDDRLEELLADRGHKALIFSQFTSLLAFVRERFDRRGWNYAYLDGSTNNRQEVVARFQEDDDCKLFLISLKAGGVGLNLTAADYVFLLDPWWNPAAESQAVDRAHRIGQEKPVVAYRLLARDTVEERVAELQERKRELADTLLGSDKSLIQEMTADDLEVLLS